MINYNKLMNNLETLKLDKMVTFLPNYLESIKEQDISIVDVLYKLTEEEIIYRDERASKIQVTVAAFPFEKEIKDFQPFCKKGPQQAARKTFRRFAVKGRAL